jgi:hypothetical protein
MIVQVQLFLTISKIAEVQLFLTIPRIVEVHPIVER